MLTQNVNADSIDLLKPFEYTNDFSQVERPLYRSALAPDGRLVEATKGVGFVKVTYEDSGDCVERTYRLLNEIDGHVDPSLALATCTEYLGLNASDIRLDERKT
jgi:hypothetical protein